MKLKLFLIGVFVLLIIGGIYAISTDFLYTSSNDLVFKNSTESSSSGARILASTLYMNFNKETENFSQLYAANWTSDYVQDNSVYGNKGDAGNLKKDGQWANGNVSNALQFDGSNDYVKTLPFPLQSSLNQTTYSFWVNGSYRTGINQAFIADSSQSASVGYIFIYRTSSSNNLIFQYSYGTGYYAPGAEFFSGYDNQWVHVTITADYVTKNITFYRNGIKVWTSIQPYPMLYPSANRSKYIGSYTTNMHFLKGSMDEMKIYNRTLEMSEITDNYNNNNVTDGLMDYWALDETSGRTAYDYIGGNNGTLTNYLAHTPTYNSSCTAYPGSGGCYEFDGVDDYILFNRQDFSSSDYADGWTLSAWINYHNTSEAYNDIFGGFALEVVKSNRKLASNYNTYKYSNGAIQIGTWTQVAITCKNDIITFYINGTNDSSQAYNCAFVGAVRLNSIGFDNYNGRYFWNGSMDDVMIWNRTLSSNEISELYSDSSSQGKYSKSGDFKSPVFYNSTSQYWNTTLSIANSTGGGIDLTNPNLVSYWKLDGDYFDSKGENNGSCTNCPNNATGLSSDAFRFDGLYDVIENSNTNGLLVPNATICFWVNPSSTTAGSAIGIGKDTAERYSIQIGTDFAYLDDILNAEESGTFISAAFTVGNWYYPCVVFYENGTKEGYINGIYKGVDTTGSNLTKLSADRFTIGARPFSSSPSVHAYYNGYVDEIVFYNKTLTTTEMTDLHKTGLSQHANTNISLQTRTATNYNLTDSELVSQWSFNINESGNSTDEKALNNGACVNSTFCPTWNESEGIIGSGYNFDGLDDSIIINNPDLMDNLTKLSISLWIKPTRLSQIGIPIGKNVGNGTNRILLYLYNNGNTYFEPYGSTNRGSFISVNYLIANKWNYITFVFDGTQTGNSNRLKAYVNSNQVALTFTGTIPATTGNNSGSNMHMGDGFNGSIDEIRIYNRSLSASEIQDLYELGNTYISDWSNWSEETFVVDGTTNQTNTVGKFFQYKAIFRTNDSSVSPYLINHSVGIGSLSVTDTCIYSSGNWNISLSDYCIVNVDTDLGTNNITFFGIGNITFNSTIDVCNIGGLPANQTGWMGNNAKINYGGCS